MSYKLGAVRIMEQTNKVNTGSVIFFHGSGDTAKGVMDWLKFLLGNYGLPHIKLIFPTAPVLPYTPLNGERSNVWFDRLDIAQDADEHKESVDFACKSVKYLIDQEVASGIPLSRIVIGGFSMGGAMALHLAYRFTPGLAGVFTLSSFLNHDSQVYSLLKEKPGNAKIPLIMFHGTKDALVPISWGENTFRILTDLKVPGEFRLVKGAFHELKKREVEELFSWIQDKIPNK